MAEEQKPILQPEASQEPLKIPRPVKPAAEFIRENENPAQEKK